MICMMRDHNFAPASNVPILVTEQIISKKVEKPMANSFEYLFSLKALEPKKSPVSSTRIKRYPM